MTQKKYNILIANGVNLDLLGQRESHHYGVFTLDELTRDLRDFADAFSAQYQTRLPHLTFFQSNCEEKFLEACSGSYDHLIINAGAWTHTSLALADRLRAIGTPYVEVHISNVFARESYRHHSYLSQEASGVITGLGKYSYHAALASILLQTV